jgi:hypothetical protein
MKNKSLQNLHKKILLIVLLGGMQVNGFAQESFGNTLNLGVGIGYYRYANHNMPVLHANYEFNVAKDFTLAPFITFYSYRDDYYWGSPAYPYRYYRYRETVVPVGVKGTYYFDDLLNAGAPWDFYLAGSLGFTIVKTTWEDGYYGDRRIHRNMYSGTSPLYLDLHIGAEYHFNDNIGLFLDLSSGVSTIGIGIH